MGNKVIAWRMPLFSVLLLVGTLLIIQHQLIEAQSAERAPTFAEAVRSADYTALDGYERVSCAHSRGNITETHQGLGDGFMLRYRFIDERTTDPIGDVPSFHDIPTIFSLHVSADMQLNTITETLKPQVDAYPGTIWFVGNEIDRYGQDGMLPEQYPVIYHTIYHAIKRWDPTALVGNGSIVQPTPLRLEYMDRVWDAYEAQYGEPMPVDLWNIHNMILREERDSWGADIPPGIDADAGMLYGIGDNASTVIFKSQLRSFRQWMADHGQREKALIVSEYGVLLPPEFGYEVDIVNQFMVDTFDFMLTETDETLGYSADGNRLVQSWTWYSCDDILHDFDLNEGFNGNLIDHETQTYTETGERYRQYLAPDLHVVDQTLSWGADQVSIAVVLNNVGLSPAEGVTFRFWSGDPRLSRTATLLHETTTGPFASGAESPQLKTITATADVALTRHPLIYLEIDPDNTLLEADETNNLWTIQRQIYMPMTQR